MMKSSLDMEIYNRDEWFECQQCNGQGEFLEQDSSTQICPDCLGVGKLDWIENIVGKTGYTMTLSGIVPGSTVYVTLLDHPVPAKRTTLFCQRCNTKEITFRTPPINEHLLIRVRKRGWKATTIGSIRNADNLSIAIYQVRDLGSEL